MTDTEAEMPQDFMGPDAAGTLDVIDYSSLETLLSSRVSSGADDEEGERPENNEEQALESHEVIELQAFSERKEWIVEKIKVSQIILSYHAACNIHFSFLRAYHQSTFSLVAMLSVHQSLVFQVFPRGTNFSNGKLNTARSKGRRRYLILEN